MTLPEDDADILALADQLGTGLVPGYVPTERVDKDALLLSYRLARTTGGVDQTNGRLFEQATESRAFAALLMASYQVLENLDGDNHPDESMEVALRRLLGDEMGNSLQAYINARLEHLSTLIDEWEDAHSQVTFIQLDAFLTGWLAHKMLNAKDDGA